MQKLISLIVPMYNESANLHTMYQRLAAVLQTIPHAWEMICVNDGSRDDTLANLIQLHQQDTRVKIVNLSRNFGKEAAMTAGLDYAQGDAVIVIDADLQDPPELIPQLIEQWQQGYDVVNAVREERRADHWFKRITAQGFYRVFNKLSKLQMPENVGDFRLLSRAAVNALQSLPERRRFMKGLFAWVGFPTTQVTFSREARHAGKTSFNYWKLWNFALEGITSFSQIPLQIFSYVGFLVAFSSFMYGFYFIVKTLIYGNAVSGYPSLLVIILFLGGIQLMGIGVLGEYLGRVYDESKQRPIYLVQQTYGKFDAPTK